GFLLRELRLHGSEVAAGGEWLALAVVDLDANAQVRRDRGLVPIARVGLDRIRVAEMASEGVDERAAGRLELARERLGRLREREQSLPQLLWQGLEQCVDLRLQVARDEPVQQGGFERARLLVRQLERDTVLLVPSFVVVL